MPLPISQDDQEEFLNFVSRNDSFAKEYLRAIARLVFIADDLADENLSFDVKQKYLMEMLWIVMVILPRNRFHTAFGESLSGLMADVIVQWQKSDQWKVSGDLKRQIFGFVRRENIDGVVVAVAAIVGGMDHAAAVTERLMDVCHSHGETLEDWIAEGKP